jgi:hypothetical protein
MGGECSIWEGARGYHRSGKGALRVDAYMLAQYTESNKVKKNRQSEQLWIDASEAIGKSEQDAIQEWLESNDNGGDALKIMAPLRGRWLNKKLGTIF